MTNGMWSRYVFLSFLMTLLVACVAPPKLPPSEHAQWRGRLSIKINSDPVRQMSAGFTLVGHASKGQLDLYTPLGGKAAQVTWGANFASVSDGKLSQNFPDLATALQTTTGAEIPVVDLFDWLQGKQNKGREMAMGWEADTTRLSDGRLTAIRLQPLPHIELRVILEP